MLISRIVKDWHTGIDGETYDVGRCWGTVIITAYIGLAVYVAYCQGKDFKLTDFGIGIGTILASVGALLKLKEKTEPGEKNGNPG